MDARPEPGLNDPFEEAIDDALSSLPADLRAAMSNVEIVVEDEPPDGQPLLGLYRGVPLPRRSSTYSGVLPDKISIFGGWSAFVFGASRPWRMTARRRQRTGNLSRLLLPTVLVRRFHSVGTSTQWETLSLGAARVASERPGVLLVKRASIEVTAGVELRAAVPRGCK